MLANTGNCKSYVRIWYGVGVLKILRSGMVLGGVGYFAIELIKLLSRTELTMSFDALAW